MTIIFSNVILMSTHLGSQIGIMYQSDMMGRYELSIPYKFINFIFNLIINLMIMIVFVFSPGSLGSSGDPVAETKKVAWAKDNLGHFFLIICAISGDLTYG